MTQRAAWALVVLAMAVPATTKAQRVVERFDEPSPTFDLDELDAERGMETGIFAGAAIGAAAGLAATIPVTFYFMESADDCMFCGIVYPVFGGIGAIVGGVVGGVAHSSVEDGSWSDDEVRCAGGEDELRGRIGVGALLGLLAGTAVATAGGLILDATADDGAGTLLVGLTAPASTMLGMILGGEACG